MVQYLFQFNSGATYTVDVRYSSMLQRQYIDTEIRLVASFLRQTEGLCGYMDNNLEYDLVTPDGRQLTDTTAFAESCKLCYQQPCAPCLFSSFLLQGVLISVFPTREMDRGHGHTQISIQMTHLILPIPTHTTELCME